MTTKPSCKRRKLISGCASSEISLAAEVIANNVDLLTEILLRLPARSLLRFRCVSRHWLSLVSDSQFAGNHSLRNPRPSVSGLYYFHSWIDGHKQIPISLHGHTSLPTLPFLDGVPGAYNPIILHSCNGLFLCWCAPWLYVVCNLTTQKYKVLPKRRGGTNSPFSLVRLSYLAFDPSRSPHYKVIMVTSCHQIDIYSSETLSWKQVSITKPQGLFFGRRIFWNGAIHWLSTDDFLVRFDVEVEKLIAMPHPPSPKILHPDNTRHFGECSGHLLLIQTRSCCVMKFRILAMERDYSHWIVKHQVNLSPLTSIFPGAKSITGGYNFYVLSVMEGTNVKDFTLLLAIAGKVVSYNLESKTLKVLRDMPPGDFDYNINYSFDSSFQFIESLSPV